MQYFSNVCRFYTQPVARLFRMPLANSARFCSSTTPTEEDVRKAYGVLGVTAGTAFADIKRKYVNLAKQHHPDVSSSSAPHRMVEINSAYNTINRFHKSGKELPQNGKGHASTGAKSQQFYYSSQDPKYQPWHEDIDPLFYEMMWEEMKRQNEEDAFARTVNSDEFYTNFNPREKNSGTANKRKQQSYNDSSNNRYNKRNNGNGGNSSNGSGKPKQKTTTWPDADLKALVNMYQDGKSFDFIANALGKTASQVVDEFNRWSADGKKGQSSRGERRKFSKRPKYNGYKVPYYFTESPDDIPYELYEMMSDDAEDGDPYGYYGDGEDGDSYHENDFDLYMGAKPYSGGHHMHEPKRGKNSSTRGTPLYNHNSFKSNTNRKNKK